MFLRPALSGRVRYFDHLEQMLWRPAVGAVPIIWNVGPSGAGGEPMLWRSELFVIEKSATQAHPALEEISSHVLLLCSA